MKKLTKIAKVLLLMLCIFAITPIASANAQFKDLTPMHWCYAKIMDFYERGYVDGYGDGTFLPDDTITRAEYVKIVNNFFGYPKGDPEKLEFSDVDKKEWFAPYVAEAVSRGYIEGYDDGTFKPEEPIRRQEATVILSRILNIHEENYSENHEDGMAQYSDGKDIDEWAYKAIHSYSVHNFINGYPDKTVRLKRNVTRAETVELLNLLEQKVEIERPNVSSKPIVKKPVITVVEQNDKNEWYSRAEVGEDEKVTVQVHTDTFNAVVNVKVNGEPVETRNVIVEKGTTVEFDLPDGKYVVTANATKSGSKPSSEATAKTVLVDTLEPMVKGEKTEDGAKLEVTDPTTLTTDISDVNDDSVKYAWFVKVVDDQSSEESYVRPTWSNWLELSEEVSLPENAEPGEYYLGVVASDNAGNTTSGNLDKYMSNDEIVDGETEYVIVVEEEQEDNESTPNEPTQEKPIVVRTKHTIKFTAEENGKLVGITKHEKVEFGTSYSELIVPTPVPNKGYSFDEWTPALPAADEKVSGDAEYIATWKINSYDLVINYEYEDGTKAADACEIKVEYNKEYEVESPEIEGYTPSIKVVTGTMGVETVEVKVVYAKNTYDLTIRYVYANGKKAAAPYEDILEYSEEYDVTSPVIEGHTADIEKVTGTITEDVEVTVTYTINEYDLTIKYVYKDGSEAAASYEDTLEHNEEYDVKSPVIEGYTANAEKVSGTITEDVEVTVTYEINKHNVYFDENDGSLVDDMLLVPYGTQIDVSEVISTKTGYDFKGWKKGTSKVTEFTMPDEDVTLKADWDWIEPDIVIEKFVSTNYPDTAGNIKAEPGNTIEYEMVIKNNESSNVIISLDFNKDVTLIEPASLDNISLNAGKSITIKVKAVVPSEYPVAENDFELKGTVEAEYNGTTGDVEAATVKNKIEKSSTTVLKNPEAKNIILILDLSNSMNKSSNKKEDRIGALKVEAKNFVNKLRNDSVGEINLTLIGIGADHKNSYISGTLEEWNSGTPNADAFILGSYTLNDWNKLLTKIDGLVAYGGTNITGSMSITSKILTGTKYRNKIKYEANAKDYVVILTDGANGPNGDVAIKGNEAAIVAVRNNADYLAAIGFGSEAADTSERAYKDLVNITSDASKVYSAAKQTDLDKAFSDIANHIGKEQSVGGYTTIDVKEYNGNIYPIRVTHKVGSTDVELFRINHPVTTINWMDGSDSYTTDIKITDDEVVIRLSGTAFSAKQDLKIIVGENPATYTATFILNNGEDNIVKTQEAGSTLEAPTEITNGEYRFRCWAPEVPSTMPADDVEYEAMWDVIMKAKPPILKGTVDEPVVDEPVVDEPAVDEPVVDEPVVDEPVVDEPVVDEPVVDEPVVDEPVVDEPVVDEPVVDEPVVDEPVVDEPVVDEPVVDEPVVDEPVVDEPVVDEPVVDEPVVDEPVVDEPVVDEPVVDEPVVDEPVVDEPVVDEPVVDEPVVDEPVILPSDDDDDDNDDEEVEE